MTMNKLIAIALLLAPFAAFADDPATVRSLVADALSEITEVDVSEAHALMDEGALVIDVREPAEFAAGHLPGAINIPRGVLEFRIAGSYDAADPGQPVVVYCRSGKRSALATQALNAMGYTGAVSMNGGFLAWEASEMETED
jgi:rhodanese-related sulfurtransferase